MFSDFSQSVPFPNGDPAAFRILMQPNQFLHQLAESIRAPFLLYSRDTTGRLIYLSHSAEAVLDQPVSELKRHSLLRFLTDSPCNGKFRTLWSCGSGSDQGTCHTFEMNGRGGTNRRIEYSEVPIVQSGDIIGYCGLMRRAEAKEVPMNLPGIDDDAVLMERAASLSAVERQVVELVVDGNINKQIAKVLQVAVRTIESRRSRAMSKMQASSLSHLVQMWLRVRKFESSVETQGEPTSSERG